MRANFLFRAAFVGFANTAIGPSVIGQYVWVENVIALRVPQLIENRHRLGDCFRIASLTLKARNETLR